MEKDVVIKMGYKKNLVLIFLASAMTACGGGSGGGSAPATQTDNNGVVSGVVASSPNQAYNGIQGQMPVTENNTRELLESAFVGGALGTVQGLSKSESANVSGSVSSSADDLLNEALAGLSLSLIHI